jgi:ABC-type proline/glycine betaine transport system ATPase subunit
MTDLNVAKTSSDVIQAPVIIAVMGLTGSGKSTFVQKASGLQNIEIGHNLNSCP